MAGVRTGAGRRVRAAVAAAVALLALLGACAGENDGDGAGAGSASDQAGTGGGADEFRSAARGTDATTAAIADVNSSTLPGLGPTVIKKAFLDIEVAHNDFQSAMQEGSTIAGEHGGYVLSTEVTDAEEGFGSVVIRVPSEEFESALVAAQQLGDVQRNTVSGQDVGEEFVDLHARLRNFEAQEAVLLRLMRRTTTIRETIDVQEELTQIQLEVERIKGRLRFLEDQTSFGTITIELREAGAVIARPTTIERAWERAASVALAIVSGLIVSAGAAIPVVLLALIALAVYRIARPLVRSEAR
ncbi:MAG: DUF4349 domain-containing protein [Actinomycetota bacterium]